MPETMHLTNDDEPTKLDRRSIQIERTDLTINGQEAAVASVAPPLTGNGWENGEVIILVSRIRNVSIRQIIEEQERRPARVFVCRYLGDTEHIPGHLSRDDVSIEFWGLLE